MGQGTDEDDDGAHNERPDSPKEIEKLPPEKVLEKTSSQEEKSDSLGIPSANSQDPQPSKRVQGMDDVGYNEGNSIPSFTVHNNESSREAAEQEDYDKASSRELAGGKDVATSEGKLPHAKHDEDVNPLPPRGKLEVPAVGMKNGTTSSDIDHAPSQQPSDSEIAEEVANFPANHGDPANRSTDCSDDPESLWQTTIDNMDCSGLKELLKKNDLSCLWKYKMKWRTALDVAAIKGDVLLAGKVLDCLYSYAPKEECFRIIGEYHRRVVKVISSEKLLNGMSKKNTVGIRMMAREKYELAVREEWRRAIERKDCVQLQILAKIETAKILEIRRDGFAEGERTALHVAAMQGCLPLAKQLLDDWKPSTGDYIEAIDKQSGMTAFEMAYYITGNRSISEYIKMIILKHKGDEREYFYETYPQSAWYQALRWYDSFELQKLLQSNSRLLLETYHGATVLHRAIERDDLVLVQTIVKLFGNEKNVSWGESYYPTDLRWEEMEKRSPTKLDDQTVSMLKSAMAYRGSALGLAKKLRFECIVDELEKYYQSPIVQAEASTKLKYLPEHNVYDNSEMKSWIDEIWNGDPTWQNGFKRDMDFNFETGPRLHLLRVHYACKDPVKFGDFLKELYRKVRNGSESSVFNLHDGQGRTPYHILMAHSHLADRMDPFHHFIEIFWISSINELPKDGRGRGMLGLFFTKEYILHKPYLRPINKRKFAFHSMFDWKYTRKYPRKYYPIISKAGLIVILQFALFMKEMEMAQEIMRQIPEWPKDDFWLNEQNLSVDLLHIVASFANQTVLQSLLDAKCDPMNVDRNGRTSLHHAADPTLLNLECVDGDCFSTVEDLCKVRKKWQNEKQKYAESYEAKDELTMGIYNENLRGDDVKMKVNQEKKENQERKACILMLLQAGVDLSATDDDGKVPNIGPTNDSAYQSWWYDMVVKDTTDKKNSFNQGGNALSVVGTLVAATSYIGPLQPPMNYDGGYVQISENLVKIFMVTNTLAFYLAITAVMFAVVPSLSMPREGVMSELKQARRMVSASLCLLLVAIGMIIISFASASLVVIENEHSFHTRDLLFWPSIMGWLICFFGVASFFIRTLKLVFYENSTIQWIYRLSFIEFCKKLGPYWWFYCYYFPKYWVYSYEVIQEIFINNWWQQGNEWRSLYILPLSIFLAIVLTVFSPLIHLCVLSINSYRRGLHSSPYD